MIKSGDQCNDKDKIVKKSTSKSFQIFRRKPGVSEGKFSSGRRIGTSKISADSNMNVGF